MDKAGPSLKNCKNGPSLEEVRVHPFPEKGRWCPSLEKNRAGPLLENGRTDPPLEKDRSGLFLEGRVGPSLGRCKAAHSRESVMEYFCCSKVARDMRVGGA